MMTLTLDKMELEVSGRYMWACSAALSGDPGIWAGERDHSVEGS